MAADLYQPSERRPIAARDLHIMHAISQWLVRRGISPNAISLLGIVASILAGFAFCSTSWPPLLETPSAARLAWFAGGLFVQLRLLANLLDGMVAIASGKASPLGELYNEVPDRISDAATFIGLGYAAGSSPTVGYLAALAAVFTAYVRVMAKVAGGPQDYCGPFAKQQRIFVVTLCAAYMAISPQAWRPDWSSWQLPSLTLALLILGTLLTAARRLARVARILKR